MKTKYPEKHQHLTIVPYFVYLLNWGWFWITKNIIQGSALATEGWCTLQNLLQTIPSWWRWSNPILRPALIPLHQGNGGCHDLNCKPQTLTHSIESSHLFHMFNMATVVRIDNTPAWLGWVCKGRRDPGFLWTANQRIHTSESQPFLFFLPKSSKIYQLLFRGALITKNSLLEDVWIQFLKLFLNIDIEAIGLGPCTIQTTPVHIFATTISGNISYVCRTNIFSWSWDCKEIIM